jgi:DNA-binding NtrC family response regulator
MKPPVPSPDRQTIPYSPPPATILLVEDDLSLRLMLRLTLESQGYQVVEATDRLHALAMLEARPETSVVLLDLGLPPHEHETSEGLLVLRALQGAAVTAKNIVLTGQDQESDALEAIREGAFDFLGKPAATAEIYNAVRRAILFARKEVELAGQGVTRLHINTSLEEGMKGARNEAEENLVRRVLRDTGFNVNQSAKRLGVKRESIYYFMKKFGIERHD